MHSQFSQFELYSILSQTSYHYYFQSMHFHSNLKQLEKCQIDNFYNLFIYKCNSVQ